MTFEWQDIVTVIATALLLGGAMVALLRRFFVSTEKCKINHNDYRGKICKKVDDLRAEIKEDRLASNSHYVEIKESLGIITGKLERM